ncbi:MAG: PEP-CTERM sorting domain-containing protein [Burkholderiaceae bacterium]
MTPMNSMISVHAMTSMARFSRAVSLAAGLAASAVIAAGWPAGEAQAVALTGFASNGAANTVDDYSGGQLLSFDLNVYGGDRFDLSFAVDAADVAAGQLTFNALVNNLSGFSFPELNLLLTGVSFDGAGSVVPSFGGLSQLSTGAQGFSARFLPAEPAIVFIGDPTGAGGARLDWTIDVSQLSAGDTFSMSVATVPEPSMLALLLAGGGLLGRALRRRGPARCAAPAA